MAQALFEVLAGVASIDNQTALAVQSLLESQAAVISDTTTTTTSCLDTITSSTIDDDDVFQCGKCKKQFTSLPVFMNHKREQCTTNLTNLIQSSSTTHLNTSDHNTSCSVPPLTTNMTQTLTSTAPPQIQNANCQISSGYTTITTSPLPQSMVLNETELLSLTSNMENGTLTIPGTSIPNTLFLPQISPSSTSNLLTAIPTSRPLLVKTETQPTTSCPTVVAADLVKKSPNTLSKPVSPGDKNDQNPNGASVNLITEFHATMVKPKRRGNNGSLSSEALNKIKINKLQCAYCDKYFSKNFDLQQHIRSHTGEKPFQCIVCGRAFAQKSNVKKHMQTHKVWPGGLANTLPTQPLPQKISNNHANDSLGEKEENLSEPAGLQVNTSVDDSGKLHIMIDNSYICQYCNIVFKTYFELKTHLKSHKNEQVYKCILKTCAQTFQDLESFLDHTKTHENEMTYRCHLCSKVFASLYELGVHQYSHSLYPNQGSRSNPPKYYRCTKCLNKYATPEALDHHMSTSNHNYPCPHCNKIFPCERYLRRHLPTHGTVGLHVCSICSKAFKTEYYLKMHMLIHSGEKPFSCSLCTAAFNRKDKLKRHLLIHEPVKRFKCPFRSHTGCLKEFNRPDKLKAHIITHSGLKPYKCRHCCRTFSRKPHLREHEKLHVEDYRYRCDVCNKGFMRQKQLQEHGCGDREKRKRVFRVGRPRKKFISTGNAEIKSDHIIPRKRGRPRKKPLIDVSESQDPSESAQMTDIIRMPCPSQPNVILSNDQVIELQSPSGHEAVNVDVNNLSELKDPTETNSTLQDLQNVFNVVENVAHLQNSLHYNNDGQQTVTVLGSENVIHCSQVILTVAAAEANQ